MADGSESPRFPRAGRDSIQHDPNTLAGLSARVPPVAVRDRERVAQNFNNNSRPTHDGDYNDGLLDVYGEGLNSDFRETPWKKPSPALAAKHRASTMYGDGKAAIWGRADTSLFQMGEGVGLYFIYLRRMMGFSVVATVLTLPHLLMSFFGDSLTRAEMDPLRLLTFAAGNHRLANVSDSTTTEFHPCEGGGNETVPTMFLEEGATCDDQFLRFFGEPEVLLTAKNGSYMIMICDVLCCVVFMLLYWRFSHEIEGFEERADNENVTPADYAVEVRGIPEDATDEEVIQHFSELFRLDKPGWTYRGWGCCRIGKKTADMPDDVTDCAGVSIGASLKAVESTEHSRFDHVCRGTWLAECSLAHPEGDFIRQSRKMTSMSEKILEARARVKKIRSAPYTPLRRRRLRYAEGRLAILREALERGARELKSRAQKFEFISWKTSSAFVVFNHETSVTRCLADYGRYPLWMQPPILRFRGVHRIRVKRAPEAGNILWENLELTKRERGRRKTLTLWVTIVLLGLSFLILYASNIAEKEFNAADSESEERCLVTIPAEHGLPSMTPFVGSLSEDTCPPNYMWVTLEGSPYQSAGQEDGCLEPCVDSSDSSNINCGDGVSFSPLQIATCLCRQQIEDHGVEALDFVQRAGGGCWSYGTKYAVGQLLTIVASANVVVINFGLKFVLKRMSAFERHPSVTEQAVSNTWKIALALFINSACVVLLVNLPGPFSVFGSTDTASTARSASEATDSSEWYTTTGQALITTIAINVVAPRVPDLLEYFALGPWRRRVGSAARVITQKQLNRLWTGQNFDLSSRLPITLMMMAVAMTFSPALPVLFPMITIYLVCTYFGDKFHLLRVCRTPPQYDGRIVKVAVHSMPWMLVCHCVFALFAFSGDAFFASDFVADAFSSDVEDKLGDDVTTQSVSESMKLICLPYVIMPVLVAVYTLFTSAIGKLIRLSWSLATCKCIRGSAKVSGPKIRVTNPPYTEVFERGYPPRETVPTFFQREMKWIVREDARGCHFLHKAKNTRTASPKLSRRNGALGPELMLTWEVLQSVYPTHTFHMEDNPAYRDIVVTRNVIAKELGIKTPKSPGGKLWSPSAYDMYTGKTKVSSPRSARRPWLPGKSPR